MVVKLMADELLAEVRPSSYMQPTELQVTSPQHCPDETERHFETCESISIATCDASALRNVRCWATIFNRDESEYKLVEQLMRWHLVKMYEKQDKIGK